MVSDSVKSKKTNPLRIVFGEAIEKARKIGSLPMDYVGKIILHCNNGGVTAIEKHEMIK